jgi:tRNA (cytosine34-C5)-methyltransferase
MGKRKNRTDRSPQKRQVGDQTDQKEILDQRGQKPVVLENADFQNYYTIQNVWSAEFADALKTPLPVSFRFTGSRKYAHDLKEFMKTELFPILRDVEIDGVKITPPEPVGWYPNDLCWVFDCGRTTLRRSPQVQKFHRFLVSETEVGNISRQEVVSMIPVNLLDVKPGQYVLDTCASPGSKTAQLLEMIHPDDQGFPDGLIIANDAEQSRCYTLVHQAKRLHSPCLLVTNHQAQDFPRIYLNNSGANILQFDRILCDVPCSGDGTVRKNPTVWKRWNTSNGNGLHKLQRQILRRACEMLKVGGRLVYSTCSFNPVENEAVVASVLEEAQGAVELIDVSNDLPGLNRVAGLQSWKVVDKSGKAFETFASANGAFVESMFPPTSITSLSMERWFF